MFMSCRRESAAGRPRSCRRNQERLLETGALSRHRWLVLSGYAAAADKSLSDYQTAEKLANAHIVTFDTLDFDVFTSQKWDRLKESHSKDITVHWPDGHETKGIEKHIDDLKAMFVYAPDTRIKVHPVKFGAGDWTSVIGEMEGTFTKPMPLGDGKSIEPTGKSFKLPMCTVGH